MKKLLILAVLLSASAAYAADRYACCQYKDTPKYGLQTNTTRVEFFGGVAWPNVDWTANGQDLEIGDTGFSAGLAFVRNVLPWLSLGLDGNYTGFSKGDEFTTTTSDKVRYNSGVATALFTGRAYLFPQSMTRLYGTAGIGGAYAYAREKNETTNKRDTVDSLDIGWMLGGGVEFDIDETVVFGAEARYNWAGLRSDMKDKFGHKHLDYWSVMLKLGVKF